MFLNNEQKTRVRHVYVRSYCAFMTLLATGKVLAEDDAVEIDPNASFSIFDVLSKLWRLLIELA